MRDIPDFCCPTWSWMIIDVPVRWSSTVLLTQPQLLGQVYFDQLTTGQVQKLHISGPGQPVTVGAPFSEDLNHSNGYDKQFPESRISWLDSVDAGTNRIVSGTGRKMIGWVMLDTADEPGEVIAVPLVQYFRLDDEEEPMVVDFLALARTAGQDGRPPRSGQHWYRRVGRGRVIKDAFTWLEDCKPLNFVVV